MPDSETYAEDFPQPEPLVSARQIAQWAGVSDRTVDTWVRAGLPCIRLPGSLVRRFSVSECWAWLQARQQDAA